MFDLAAADPSVRFSPYCWRITMACAHKGIPLERVPWRIFSDKPVLPSPNSGTVPVIVDPNNGGAVEHDSLRIASYLERTYPDLPSLFGNAPGAPPNESAERLTHFVAAWAERVLVPPMGQFLVADIWSRIDPSEQEYFRRTREKWYKGRTLEEVQSERDSKLASFRQLLSPARAVLKGDLGDRRPQPWLGSPSGPTFADFVVFGLFQWARCISPGFAATILKEDDPLAAWFERMLDLYGGLGRNAPVWKE
ncbi:putative beta etherase [Hyaloraphidium curvatum]|nr:putative beta etherase [Hyaloraphidium curvatum]